MLEMCRETVRKVERLHQWDVARANKAPFAFGIEPRVPFLDKAFLATSMSIDPQDKMVGPPASQPVWEAFPDKPLCLVPSHAIHAAPLTSFIG